MWEPCDCSIGLLQVEHMTELMLKGGRDDTDQEGPSSKGNRRETWAPGLAGTALTAAADNNASPAEWGLLCRAMHSMTDFNLMMTAGSCCWWTTRCHMPQSKRPG